MGLLLLAGACSSSSEEDDDGAAEEWSVTDEHFVSQPVAAGDQVVALVADIRGVTLVAYAAESGEELWRRPSSLSGAGLHAANVG